MVNHKLTIETRGNSAVLICSHCQKPFLEIENGQVKIGSKHGSSKHENILMVEDLRMLALIIWQQQHPPERW